MADRLGAKSVALYYPFGTEPDLAPFAEALDRALIPRLFSPDGRPLGGGCWGLHRAGNDWEQPRAGAPRQPRDPAPDGALQEADLLLIPALLADESGTRLGRGGGWYDRVLATLTKPVPLYAVVYSWEVLPAGALPAEPHDVPVDGVLTELGSREFAR